MTQFSNYTTNQDFVYKSKNCLVKEIGTASLSAARSKYST
jgi:hypothetical protein